jgi:hypothetical protein
MRNAGRIHYPGPQDGLSKAKPINRADESDGYRFAQPIPTNYPLV